MATVSDYSLPAFLDLPTETVAGLIRGLTLAFPIDGTRRWFMAHHPASMEDMEAYKQAVSLQYVAKFRMLFDHGVETILVPAFGGELLSRGADYVREMFEAMTRLAQHPIFAEFYHDYDVRVRFYGDWRRQTACAPGADELAAAFDGCLATQHTGSRRIFYGIYADDILVTIADDLARNQHARMEFTREAIVTRYYGEYVRPTDIYIGFGRPIVFDVPMLMTSQTDLYYTVVPSLELDARLFRMIVWDHFAARWGQQDWHLDAADFTVLSAFYASHHDRVLGLGDVDPKTGIWYPQGLRPIADFRRQ